MAGCAGRCRIRLSFDQWALRGNAEPGIPVERTIEGPGEILEFESQRGVDDHHRVREFEPGGDVERRSRCGRDTQALLRGHDVVLGNIPQMDLEALGPTSAFLRCPGPSDVDPGLRGLLGSPQWQPECQGGCLMARYAARGHHLLGQSAKQVQGHRVIRHGFAGNEHTLAEAGDPP